MNVVVVVVVLGIDELLLLLEGGSQGLLIDQRTGMFCHLVCHFDLLLFSCGTCRRSRISLCTSWHFCDTHALPSS